MLLVQVHLMTVGKNVVSMAPDQNNHDDKISAYTFPALMHLGVNLPTIGLINYQDSTLTPLRQADHAAAKFRLATRFRADCVAP